jgi:hypothetical protein
MRGTDFFDGSGVELGNRPLINCVTLITTNVLKLLDVSLYTTTG